MLLGRSALMLPDLKSVAWRNQKIVLVLQESTLIRSLSIPGSIKLPLLYAGILGKGHSGRFGQVVNSLSIGSILGKTA